MSIVFLALCASVAGALVAFTFAASPTLAAEDRAPRPRSLGQRPPETKAPPAPPCSPCPTPSRSRSRRPRLVFYGKYECEFSQTVDITQSAKYPAYVDLGPGKSDWLMKPVLSSTGVIRLEDVLRRDADGADLEQVDAAQRQDGRIASSTTASAPGSAS